ncbi:MAG: substrate-binding domain-containing protein [Trichlorobacter sp.]|jgi:phosphate binding protein
MEKGTTLYKYRIAYQAHYGEGTLWVAEHILLGKQFLLKPLTPANAADQTWRDRFYGEAQLLAQLVHPNILQATDFFEHDHKFWLVLDYYEGAALDRIIDHNGAFPVGIALHYTSRLLQGLDFAHGKGVIHRGLKPSNILVDRKGGLKIADFGVALLKDQTGHREVGQGGEAAFMSPEQILNPREVAPQSDIYAVGMLLYSMLAGRVPVEQRSTVATLLSQLDDTVPDIRDLVKDIPEPLAMLVHRALEKDPAKRFQSCQEFLVAIEAYRQSLLPKPELPAEGVSDSWWRRRKGAIIGSLLGSLLMASGAGYYYHWINSYDVVLRLHGSNTIGAALAPALAEEYLKKAGAIRTRRLLGSNHEELLVEGIMERKRNLAVEIKAHGSSTAFEDMANGSCDIGMSSRRIKEKEVKALAPLGAMTSRTSEHVLALDGVAVIVNSANAAVSSLTMATVKGIFSGQIGDWGKVTGAKAGSPIKLYARDDKSGTYDTFKSLVLGDDKLAKTAKRFEDSNLLSTEVAADSNGIGFIGLPYIKSARAVAISGGPQAILPNAFTVATEDYSLARRLYLYTASQPGSQRVKEFIEFALSPAGQELAEKVGFVPLTVKATAHQLPANAPDSYRRFVQDAERLSLNFKFTGDGLLDNKAVRDLDRLVKALSTRELQGRQILLFGFTDNEADPKSSLSVANQRVGQVAQELRQRGVVIAAAEGYGAQMPVADNGSREGKQRNNRVEVWVTKR